MATSSGCFRTDESDPRPGVIDDERRTIAEMLAEGTYASINLATADLDSASSGCRPAAPKSFRSRPRGCGKIGDRLSAQG
jgi:hypothetical protein